MLYAVKPYWRHTVPDDYAATKVTAEDLPWQRETRALRLQWQQLDQKYIEGPGPAYRTAATTLQYNLDQLAKASSEDNQELLNKRLDICAKLLLPLRQAAPFSFLALRGDLPLAYYSEDTQQHIPFRLYVPTTIDFRQRQALLVLLHGRSGDENTMFDSYGDRQTGRNLVKSLADRYGYIVLSPQGGGPGSGYRDTAARDVVQVTQLVQQLLPIDGQRTFLSGHSMGGGGTLLIGLEHPDLYRALAPIGGGLWVAAAKKDWKKGARQIPVRFYQGSADRIVPADPAALKKTRSNLRKFSYRRITGADHTAVFYEGLPAAMEWFQGFR